MLTPPCLLAGDACPQRGAGALEQETAERRRDRCEASLGWSLTEEGVAGRVDAGEDRKGRRSRSWKNKNKNNKKPHIALTAPLWLSIT